MAAAPILSLPLEIISLILQTLPNADHLLSAACSHSLFYQTIKEHEEAICDAVSLNTMDEYIYPYALGAASIRSRPFDYDFICNVLSDVQFRTYNFPSRGSVNFKCESNLRSALYINNLAKSAAYFSFRFEDETMPRADVDLKLGRRDMDTRATAGELYLIHRALFRYQIYCEIVMSWGKARGPDGSLPQDVFTEEFITHLLLGHLPPWVNEQLACVYDCLRSFFFPKYARVAKHDVEWGAMLMEYEEPSPNTGFVQGLMTYGLRFLEKVDKAQTYDEIRAVLTSVPLVYSARGLGYLLSCPLDWRTLGLRPSAAVEMVPADDMEVVSKDLCLRACEKYCERMGAEKPWFLRRGGDPDPSLTATVQRLYLDSTERYPYRMWHLAMEPFQLRHCHYSNRLPLLRLCGYLLWDGCGDNVNVDTVGEGISYLQSIAGNHVSELYLRAVQKHVSWRARADIYMDGGRGYWSEDGVHRIEWTGERVDTEVVKRLAKTYTDLTIPELPHTASDEDSASETE